MTCGCASTCRCSPQHRRLLPLLPRGPPPRAVTPAHWFSGPRAHCGTPRVHQGAHTETLGLVQQHSGFCKKADVQKCQGQKGFRVNDSIKQALKESGTEEQTPRELRIHSAPVKWGGLIPPQSVTEKAVSRGFAGDTSEVRVPAREPHSWCLATPRGHQAPYLLPSFLCGHPPLPQEQILNIPLLPRLEGF